MTDPQLPVTKEEALRYSKPALEAEIDRRRKNIKLFQEQVANEESIGENQGESDSAESENSENEDSGDENNNEASLSEIENNASDENINELEIEELPVSDNGEPQEIIVGKDDEAISSEEPKDNEGGELI